MFGFYDLIVGGSDNIFSGVKFHGGGSSTPITVEGERNSVAECVVEHHQAQHWLQVAGVENTVRHCRFSQKTATYPYEGSSAGKYYHISTSL